MSDKLAFKQDFDPTIRKGAYKFQVDYETPSQESLLFQKIFPGEPVELKVRNATTTNIARETAK